MRRNAFRRFALRFALLLAFGGGVSSHSRLNAAEAAPAATTPSTIPADDYYDMAGQQRRSEEFANRFVETRLELFDDQGRWQGPAADKPWRSLEIGSYLVPFLHSGNAKAIAAANGIYAHADENFKGLFDADSYQPLPEVVALTNYKAKLTEPAIKKLEKICRVQCEQRFKEDRWDFQGDNDNFPILANATLAAWGAYAKKPELIELARKRFEQYQAILTRRGFGSEYNSAAYIGIQLNGFAAAAELVAEPQFRRLALDLETRLWVDLLSHYHAPTGSQGGPWSRQYNFGLYNVPLSTHWLWLVFGDKLPGNYHGGYSTESLENGSCRAANESLCTYHCPKWLAEWALNRHYPHRVMGMAEGGASYCWLKPDREDYLFHWMWQDTANKDANTYTLPAWHSRLVQYQTEEYCLGTASRMFNDGVGGHTFVVTVPLASPLTSTGQVTRIHARYVVDEVVPGVTPLDDFMKQRNQQINFADAGRTINLQHDQTALVLYRPHIVDTLKPRSLKTMVILPHADGGAGKPCCDEIFIGEQAVHDVTGDSVKPAPVFLRIHNTYMALLPLINNEAADKKLVPPAAVRVRALGKATCVEFFNYEGEPISLTPRQYCLLGNGFVCELGMAASHGSFEKFRARFAHKIDAAKGDAEKGDTAEGYTLSDSYRRTVHSRGAFTRRVTYERPGLKLETEYEPVTEGIRYQAINGKAPSEPQLEATDLPRAKVPFLE